MDKRTCIFLSKRNSWEFTEQGNMGTLIQIYFYITVKIIKSLLLSLSLSLSLTLSLSLSLIFSLSHLLSLSLSKNNQSIILNNLYTTFCSNCDYFLAFYFVCFVFFLGGGVQRKWSLNIQNNLHLRSCMKISSCIVMPYGHFY